MPLLTLSAALLTVARAVFSIQRVVESGEVQTLKADVDVLLDKIRALATPESGIPPTDAELHAAVEAARDGWIDASRD
jgi:hypothetical protein